MDASMSTVKAGAELPKGLEIDPSEISICSEQLIERSGDQEVRKDTIRKMDIKSIEQNTQNCGISNASRYRHLVN